MKYSIITAVYNGEAYIQRLLASVLGQSYPHIEWIVQDGGSTDGTLEILRPYANRINLESEPDTGVYDAWNRAVARASGDWVLFLGADDFLVNKHSIAQCHRHLRALPPAVAMAFGALVMGQRGEVKQMINRTMFKAYNIFLSDMGIPFPATFVRLPLVRQLRFDASFKIAGDFDFAARALTGDNLARLPLVVSYMEMGGLSSNSSDCTLLDERLRVLFSRVAPKAREIMEASVAHMLEYDDTLEPLAE